MTRSP